MNPASTVRRMRPADLDAVVVLAAGLPHVSRWPREAYLAALDPHGAPPRIALVALDEPAGPLTGFALASIITPQAELEMVAVAAGAQRRGIGRGLLTALIEELRAAAVSEFLLEVRPSNAPALALYRGLGWRETGRRSRYYSDPEEDALLMSLDLG